MLSTILATIEAHSHITIYPHQQADGDALGSTFGLKTILLERYPDKTIKVLGNHTKDNGRLFPLFDEAEDEEIANSLALILDTANAQRVDDLRYALAKVKIKIDHHPGDDNYGDINYVHPEVSSTAELIVSLAKELLGEERMSTKAATYLYAGLLSDTMSFSTASTSAKSLEAASYLANCGVNLVEVAYYFRAKSLAVYQFITELRSRMIVENNHFVYVIVPKEMYLKYDLTYEDVKGNVSEFSRIEGLLVWAIFLEQPGDNEVFLYQGSLRSRYVGINDVANDFHGGGHKYAAGVKLTDMEEVMRCVDALRQRIKEANSNETEISI